MMDDGQKTTSTSQSLDWLHASTAQCFFLFFFLFSNFTIELIHTHTERMKMKVVFVFFNQCLFNHHPVSMSTNT